jgi:hypothetical protein
VPSFGRQPGLRLALQERWSVAALSRRLDVPENHLRNALVGRTRPSDEVRDRLPALLGRQLRECFTPEALAEPYCGPYNTAPRRRPAGAR